MNPLILLAGLLALLMIFGAGVALLGGSRSEVDERMDRYVGGAPAATAIALEEPRPQKRQAVGERLDTAIGDRGFTRNIKTRIAKSDVKLRVSEYIALRIGLALVAGGLVYFLLGQNPIFIIAASIGASFIPLIYLSQKAKRRLRAFEDQLSQTLNLWVNALRSGYSVLQSMEAIATELPAPVSTEFERVVQEVRLGLSVGQALAS